MNQFAERYKTQTTTQLLRVIENPTDYQPAAVEAAQYEIDHRELSEEELADSKRELEAERQDKENEKAKKDEVERKVKSYGALAFEAINPLQQSAPTADRLITLVTIVFGIMAIFNGYTQYGLAKYMLMDNTLGWDLSMVEFFLPLILLPVAIILFWFRKTIGWTLMAIFLTYSAISAFVLLIFAFLTEPSDSELVNTLFPQPSVTTKILITIFFVGTLWVLNRKDVREKFKMSRSIAIGTMALTAMFTLWIISRFFL